MNTPAAEASRAPLRVVVVGSGLAGLLCAIETSGRGHQVTLLTKSQLSESNTRYAQGGIAAALFPDDSPEAHIADTLFAAAGVADTEMVRTLCEEGPDRVRDLMRLGTRFDHTDGHITRGLEAAHSSARIVHAGGDATGAEVERALIAALERTNTTVLEHAFLRDLVLDDQRVVGVRVLLDGVTTVVDADRVVLASGGAGQLFLHTTNPDVTTGDGVAAALRAGAVLGDLEFYQFHPTALATAGNFLVSEAVRGEGAVLRDRQGHRFMPDIDPLAELAPRDVVARGIATTMAKQDGAPVWLDATGLGADFLRARFPSITAECDRQGIDWTAEPVPVTPAAHYWMGGVATDEDGRTSVQGLFAIGEVANTGVHGANRLASNSLLEAAVFAHRCASVIADPWRDYEPEALTLPEMTPESVAEHFPEARDAESVPPFSRVGLQTLLWDHVGLSRSADSLSWALHVLTRWQEPSGDSVHQAEDRNLLDVARAMTWAALSRQESRGAHYRTDYPHADPAFARPVRWRRGSSVLAGRVGESRREAAAC